MGGNAPGGEADEGGRNPDAPKLGASKQPAASYTDNLRIALYRNGELYWGIEPGPTLYCGDGVVEPPEICDDGGNSASCDADCTPAVCGDNFVNPAANEICDDGNSIDETTCPYGTPTCTGCAADCSVILDLYGAYCGEGVLDSGEGEVSDPGLESNCLPDCSDYASCTDPTTCLHVQHLCRDPSAPNDAQVMPELRLVNNGTESVPYSQLTIRYWFTRDSVSVLEAACDYAYPVACSNITRSFTPVVPARSGADYYLEVGFTTTAQLAPGAAQSAMQLRVHKQNWSNFAESNDYSYHAYASYTPSPVITVYRNGELIWGIEP